MYNTSWPHLFWKIFVDFLTSTEHDALVKSTTKIFFKFCDLLRKPKLYPPGFKNQADWKVDFASIFDKKYMVGLRNLKILRLLVFFSHSTLFRQGLYVCFLSHMFWLISKFQDSKFRFKYENIILLCKDIEERKWS